MKKFIILLAIALLFCFMQSSCYDPAITRVPTSTPSLIVTAKSTKDLDILSPSYLLPNEDYSHMNQGYSSITNQLVTSYGICLNVSSFIYYSQYGNTEYVKLCTNEICSYMYNDCDSYVDIRYS